MRGNKENRNGQQTGGGFSTGEQIAVEKAVEASGDIRLHGIVLCLYTGLRIGELLGLTWEDVDLENGIITVNKTVYRGKDDAGRGCLVVDRPKTKASNRLIPLPDYVIRMLEEDLRRSGSRFVVPGKGGERMPVRTYQHLFRRLTERADVPRKGFHALRHTFATRAVESGMDIRTLADIMGHQNASVTLNRYAHCMMSHKIQAMKNLPLIR